MQRSKLVLTLLAAPAVALAVGQSHAQTLTTLATFNGANGQDPTGDVTLSADGTTLYGMTATGGSYGDGTIFSIPVAGGTLTTLLSFNGANGALPYGNLTLSADGSTLYGMTSAGVYDGNIFSIPAAGGTPTNLLSFNGTNGESPYGSLTLVGSTLYGMTAGNGGASNEGNIFSIPAAGGTPSTLFSFNGGGALGAEPIGSLTLSANGSTFYGMTSGDNDTDGNIFSIPVTGGTPANLLSFNGTDGNTPYGNLTLSADGSTLYGMTLLGGTHGDGNIFSIPVAGGGPAWESSFNGTDGASPFGSLTLVGSTLYGMTAAGGLYNDGTIFSIPVTGGTPTTLLSFNGTNGDYPQGSLTLIGSTLYGMTASGGEGDGHGTVFALVLPEPSSAVLLSLGAIGLGAMALRRRMRKHAA